MDTVPRLSGNTVSYSEKGIFSGILNFSATKERAVEVATGDRTQCCQHKVGSSDPLSPGTPRPQLLTGVDNALLQISPFPAAAVDELRRTGKGCHDPGRSNSRHQRAVQECDGG